MDSTTREDLKTILELYHANQLEERPEDVGKGVWKPTPLPVLFGEIISLDILCARERKNHKGQVLTAGAGDGRRAAMLNRLGYNVFAVELNPNIVRHADYVLQLLIQKGLIDDSRIKIVEGDFLDDNLYRSNGTEFEAFQMVFAYLRMNNLDALVRKLENRSPKGVELFALRHLDWESQKTNLPYKGSGVIRVPGHTHYSIDRYVKQ